MGLPVFLAAVVLSSAASARAQFFPSSPPPTPAQGYLNGAANLTLANAQYEVLIQQARIMREQANQAALETRRRALEQRLYEYATRPTPEQMRRREEEQALWRSLNNPPGVEVWSGDSLNALLQGIQRARTQGAVEPQVPLPQEVLAHVNFTTGATRGSVGVLRQGAQLHWPLALQGDPFLQERARLEELFQQAVSRAVLGGIDGALLADMGNALQSLSAKVNAHVADLTPTQFVQAMRYVGELKDTWKALQDPNARRYFSPAWTPRGATVGELVGQMTREGLHFAPCVTGGESAYSALHHALVTYGTQLGLAANR